MSIEVYSSYRNLVITPVIPEEAFVVDGNMKDNQALPLNKINLGFRNINQRMWNVLKVGTPYACATQTFKCNGDERFADKRKIRWPDIY